MSLTHSITRVIDHLRDIGAVIDDQVFGRPAGDLISAVSPALPESVNEVYRQLGDGFRLSWHLPRAQMLPHQDTPSLGKLEFPSVPELLARVAAYRDGWFCDESFDTYNVEDKQLARLTAQRMRTWSWFTEEANGDRLCIDLSSGAVLYDAHDWFDAGTGFNGHVMASRVDDFISSWAEVCFTLPVGRHWPDAFSEDGIDWSPAHFPIKVGAPRRSDR